MNLIVVPLTKTQFKLLKPLIKAQKKSNWTMDYRMGIIGDINIKYKHIVCALLSYEQCIAMRKIARGKKIGRSTNGSARAKK